MWKLLFMVAILANTRFVTSGSSSSTSQSSSSSSSCSQSRSESKSYSSSETEESDGCSDDNDDNNDSHKCGANETYVDCPEYQCRPKTCAEVGYPIACPAQSENSSCPGKPGCVCLPGFVKNKKGICIPTTDCPSCGGDKNARSGCGVNCNKHCSDIGEEPKACILICYPNSCDCKDGFYLNSEGKCVRPDQCDTKPVCGKHEVFSNCTNTGCDASTCKELGFPVPCVRLDPEHCKKGCVCEDGYVRNDKGTCIPKSECPSCGGDKNAVSGCGVNCNKHCSDIGQGPKPCILLCRINSCDCKDGYYLNDDGKCVKPEKCNTKPECGKHEVFSNCTNTGCDASTCKELGFPVPCVRLDPEHCKKGCVCEDGYVRDDKGTCIPKSECPSCGGDKNAESGCGVNCNKHCSDIGQGPKPCILLCRINSCDCKDGYYLNDEGKCVKPEKCNKPPTVCGKHEVFSNCTNGGCDARNCSQLGFPVPCVKLDPAACKKGCICDEDYLRADNGTCIPKTQCPSCGGDKNARAGCGVNCNKHCSDIGDEPKGCIEVCYDNACDCKDGFYLNKDGKCVKPDKCDEPPTVCCKHEVFSNCTNGGCDVRNCSQLGFPVPCVKLNPAACKKGCICKEGYLRADNGTCIPKSQCPSCGGDENAKSGCGVNCLKHCSPKPIPCPKICKVNACDCKDGFVYDDNIEKCVLREDCTPTCEENEVFSNCTNSPCTVRNCSQLGFPMPFSCPKMDPSECKIGCICEDGYLRAKNGTCIPRDDCPSCGGDCNAKSGCGIHCGNTCSTYKSKPVACPLLCKLNSCDCKTNYVYDTNTKKCVLPKDCTHTTPPTNTTDDSTGYCKEEDPQTCLNIGNIDFTLDFLHQMIKINLGKSIVMSPFSVLFPLAQLCLASDPGQSYKQLMSVLNLNNKDQIRKVFPALINSIQDQQDVVLDLAAKTYVNDNAVLNKTFETDSVDVFKSKAESINFADSQKAADTINNWVEEVTKGLIQNLVSPSMFSKDTRIALINAIYFLGNWQTQFNPNLTNIQDFYINKDDTVPVQMMYRKGSYKYAESKVLDAKILQIPYKGGNFSYVLILPNKVDGYVSVAERIKDSNVLNDALDSLSYNTCQLSLPRHNITTTVDLTNILKKLNITDIFDDSLSDLNGILDNLEKLSVSDAIQKAAIKVNEVGTEAAAANAIIVGTTSVVLNQIVVKADHTFLFLLLQNRNPLFCGVYAGN